MVKGVIEKYYQPGTALHELYMAHVTCVARKALELADRVSHLKPDRDFLYEASFLHDIGIIKTDTPDIYCHGEFPYLAHGYLGREMLEAENLPAHALVAERHTGVGITKEQIITQNLPLPHHNMLPISLEEKIVCFADNFFSKNPQQLEREKSLLEIRSGLEKFGPEVLQRFNDMVEFFEYS